MDTEKTVNGAGESSPAPDGSDVASPEELAAGAVEAAQLLEAYAANPDQKIEQTAFEAFAFLYPHEAHARWPDRFREFFLRVCPHQSEADMLRLINETSQNAPLERSARSDNTLRGVVRLKNQLSEIVGCLQTKRLPRDVDGCVRWNKVEEDMHRYVDEMVRENAGGDAHGNR